MILIVRCQPDIALEGSSRYRLTGSEALLSVIFICLGLWGDPSRGIYEGVKYLDLSHHSANNVWICWESLHTVCTGLVETHSTLGWTVLPSLYRCSPCSTDPHQCEKFPFGVAWYVFTLRYLPFITDLTSSCIAASFGVELAKGIVSE